MGALFYGIPMQWEKLTFSTASSAQQHLFVSVMKVEENAAFDCYYYYNDYNNNSTRRSCSVGVLLWLLKLLRGT